MGFLKTLQKGSYTFGTTQDVADIDLPIAVNTSRSFITLKVRAPQNAGIDMVYHGNYCASPSFLDSDTIRIERWYAVTGNIQVSYFVYELDDGFTVEINRGKVQFNTNPEDVVLTVTDETDCISICHLYSRYTGWSGDFDDQVMYHAVFNNAGTPTLRCRNNVVLSSPTHEVWYQVIRMPNADVTQLTINNIPNTSGTNDYDLPAAVDLDNSFLIWSCQHQDATIPSPSNQHLKNARMFDSDTVRTRSYLGMACPYARCYITELPVGSIKSIDRGWAFITGENYNVDVATVKEEEKRVTNIPGMYNHWCGADIGGTIDNFKDVGVRTTIVDGDTFTAERGDQDTNPAQGYLTYEDMELDVLEEGELPLVNHGLSMNKLTDGRLANA